MSLTSSISTHAMRALRAAALTVASRLQIWLRRAPRIPACREDYHGVRLNGCPLVRKDKMAGRNMYLYSSVKVPLADFADPCRKISSSHSSQQSISADIWSRVDSCEKPCQVVEATSVNEELGIALRILDCPNEEVDGESCTLIVGCRTCNQG